MATIEERTFSDHVDYKAIESIKLVRFRKKPGLHGIISKVRGIFAPSVFLIHDVLDKPFARRLAITLSLAGASVWLDEAETGHIRDTLTGYIYKQILGDIYLAVILSPNSVDSDCVQREIALALNRGVSGLTITILPLHYKDCAIPAFMADKIFADFQDPANYSNMLRRIFDRLKLSRVGKESALPASIAGIWQGSWHWCGRQRNAHLYLSASPAVPSKIVIQYLKSGILTIVEQTLEVQVSGNAVKLIGTGYRLLERGISLGWKLDTFNLSLGASGKTLDGINMDKKGMQSPVLFKRK